MSPHHFAKLNKKSQVSETEQLAEEAVEKAMRAAVMVIAAPFKYIYDHTMPNTNNTEVK